MTAICGPFLCMGILVMVCVQLVVAIICCFTMTMSPWYPFTAGFFVVLYGIYLLIDTQMVVGGGRHELSIDDYIIGAMILYLDIVMMFLYILEMLGRK